MDKAQAIQYFWSQFELTAYDENSVPDNAQYPYITYQAITDSLDYVVGMSASLWYRSTKWKEISQKAKEISEYITIGGKVIPLDYGYLWIFRGTPFAQRMSDENDPFVKRIYMNINVEFLTDK